MTLSCSWAAVPPARWDFLHRLIAPCIPGAPPSDPRPGHQLTVPPRKVRLEPPHPHANLFVPQGSLWLRVQGRPPVWTEETQLTAGLGHKSNQCSSEPHPIRTEKLLRAQSLDCKPAWRPPPSCSMAWPALLEYAVLPFPHPQKENNRILLGLRD